MCPFYNAQLFEITGAAKGVFTHSQSSCHIAKVVLTIRHDSRQIPIASDARPFHISRGFLHWRFAYAGPTVRAAPPSWGRHPQTFTKAVDREFPLKPDPDRFGANPHPRKVNSDSVSAAVCYEIPNQATSANSGRALRLRRGPANNSFTKFEFNQAWLAKS